MSERHARRSSESTAHPPMPNLNLDLGWILLEAVQHAGTERGRRAFERLVMVLRRSAYRIARVELEDRLSRNRVEFEAIDSVVTMAMHKLYERMDEYEQGTQVIPWFATLVHECARNFLDQG